MGLNMLRDTNVVTLAINLFTCFKYLTILQQVISTWLHFHPEAYLFDICSYNQVLDHNISSIAD